MSPYYITIKNMHSAANCIVTNIPIKKSIGFQDLRFDRQKVSQYMDDISYHSIVIIYLYWKRVYTH